MRELSIERGDKMDLGIKGKRVLVGGGTRGIGKAVAQVFASEGADVNIVARGDGRKVAQELSQKYGTKVVAYQADLSKAKEIERLRDEVGEIDILFVNVGGPKPGNFEDLTDDDWQDAYELTLMSAVRLIRFFLPGMLKNKWGRVIALTSVSVFEPIPRLLLSNSVRKSVSGLIKDLSVEYARSGITFNCVAPGYTLTERVEHLFKDSAKNSGKTFEEVEKSVADKTDVKRLAKPAEIASAIAFLASQKASYITGITLRVDGGYVKTM